MKHFKLPKMLSKLTEFLFPRWEVVGTKKIRLLDRQPSGMISRGRAGAITLVRTKSGKEKAYITIGGKVTRVKPEDYYNIKTQPRVQRSCLPKISK